jgi:hypothetical protein
MHCYGFSLPRVRNSSAKVSLWLEPLLHLVDQITSCIFPHTVKQDSHPTTSLISKKVVPYRTRGGTCYLGVYTTKTRSSADSSMTIDITWHISTVSTMPTHTQTTTSILTTVTSHHDRWKTNTLNTNTSQTQYYKDGKTCTTLIVAW